MNTTTRSPERAAHTASLPPLRKELLARTSPVLRRTPRLGAILALVLVLVLLVLPFATNGPTLGKLQQVIYFAVGVLSVTLLTGRLGQFSLGQGAYLGLGAYVTLLMTNSGVPWFVALAGAAIIPGIIGAIAGLPALRIPRGLTLALVSLGIAIVFPHILLYFSDLTGGAAGLAGEQPIPSLLGYSRSVSSYWMVVIVAAAVFLLAWMLVTSRTGRAMQALRDQEIAAQTFGINMKVIKVSMYGWTAAIAGVAGWMFAVTNQFVAPADFVLQLSFNLVLGMIIGGSGIIIGALIGGVFLVYVRDFVPTIGFDPILTPFVYGVILILVLAFLPGGFTDLVKYLVKVLRRRIRRNTPPPEVDIAVGVVEPDEGQAALLDGLDLSHSAHPAPADRPDTNGRSRHPDEPRA